MDEIKIGNYGKSWAAWAEENDREIAKLNYIFFRKKKGYDCVYDEITKKVLNPECDGTDSDADDFETSFLDLLTTCRQDQNYITQHTRLTTRAIEWDENGRTLAYLLRGEELFQAEVWLASSEEKQPQPTQLIRDYIHASTGERERGDRAERDRQIRELQLAKENEQNARRAAVRLRYLAVLMAAFFIVAGGLLIWVLIVQDQLASTELQNFYDTGNMYFDRAEYGQAIAEYTRVLERQPDHIQARYRRGLAYYHADDHSSARADFDQTLELDAAFAGSHYGLGLLAASRREYEQAVEAYTLALERDNTLADVYFSRGDAYAAQASKNTTDNLVDLTSEAEQFYLSANDDYGRALEIKSFFPKAYINRGNVYSTLGELQLAIDDFSRALELDPLLEDVYSARGNVRAALGDMDGALSDYQQFNENFVIATLTTDLFERLPVSLEQTNWVQYFGNTTFAYRFGRQYAYQRFDQGLHSAFDFGAAPDTPVFAGVIGTVTDIFFDPRRRPFVTVQTSGYDIYYYNVAPVSNLNRGMAVDSNTVLGTVFPVAGDMGTHLRMEVHSQDRLKINPLTFMKPELLFSILEEFPPSNFHFYRDSNWTRWQTPLDQPLITVGGPVVGPLAAAHSEDSSTP